MLSLIHVGLGPLGQKTVRFARERGFIYSAAVDPDPAKAGRDLGELCGLEPLGLTVQATLEEALASSRVDRGSVAIVTTVSSLRKLEPQVAALARAGLPVVSTCEELVFPWSTQPGLARRIDAVFKENGVACLGTGVNPGFLMDYLPSVVTGVCQRVERIRISRVQDASVRRVPFQQKIGAGLTLEQFREREKEGTLRHVGLAESLDLVAHKMGWRLDRKTETLEPVVAEQEVTSGYKPITKGMARGVEQIAKGFRGKDELITLHFHAAVGAPRSFDRIEIAGEPPLDLRFEGGVNGDVATCALTLNCIRSVLSSPAGLRTMGDVMPVSWFERL
jgi:4-hydroxy-tetrahydrodipicolinate reductase